MIPQNLVEIYRGDLVESCHYGHIAISNHLGQILASWGDTNTIVYPRSSVKILQALPLVETGSAKHFSLNDKHLALACSSHSGGKIHLDVAKNWLKKTGIKKEDLLCGSQPPYDKNERINLKIKKLKPSELHNNCSGKHLGFLTISRAFSDYNVNGLEYINIKHPVQQIVKKTFEEFTGLENSIYALDGCSAPNFACSLKSLAKAMALFACPRAFNLKRQNAIEKIKNAVLHYPELVAGNDRLCTKLIKKSNGRFIVKVGAEGVYTAILFELGLGVALKISDGSKRAAECLIVTLLIRLGVLSSEDEEIRYLLNYPIFNWSNKKTGYIKASSEVWGNGKLLKL